MNGWNRRVAVASVSLGLILLCVAAGRLLAEQQLGQGAAYSLIGGIALLVLGGVVDPTAIAEIATNRRARFGTMSMLISAGVIGVLVLVNVVASSSLAAADLTRAGYYTLSGQSLAVLNRLDSTLTITGFYRPSRAETATRHNEETLLALYRARNPHVVVRMVDPDLNFSLARQLGVQISGSLALQYKNKAPIVLTLGSQSEQDVTTAILKLESDRTPQICWATGDGERDLKSSQEVEGYSQAAGNLVASNYKLVEVPLGTVASVSADCDVLAIVGPTRALAGAGSQLVTDYLNRGGKLFVAMDPLRDQVTPSINGLLKPYGVAFDGAEVIDADDNHHASNDITSPVVFDYGPSPISKGLNSRFTYFPLPTGISGTPDAATIGSVQLATTTVNSYEIIGDRSKPARLPGDKPGPFVLMETLEKKQDQGRLTRIVAVGTSAVAENRTMPPTVDSGNLQLFLSSMDWLSQQEDLISVPAKPSRAVPIPATDADKTLAIVVTLVLMPMAVAVLGLYVWLRRRRVDLRAA